jgi:hypothetical protein
MSVVADVIQRYLPAKRKTTPSGWTSFNAVCCHHNGTSQDKRQRGGLISNGDGGVSYHCFNCGFKASWQPGRNLSYKMRKLLQWMNVPDSEISQVSLEVLRENEGVETETPRFVLPEFSEVPLPEDSVNLATCDITSKHQVEVIEYMANRNLFFEDADFYWSPSLAYRDRLILPFTYKGKTVGWTARKIRDGKPKYLSEQQQGFVYGMDAQTESKIFGIVCEGPLDAVQIEGMALLGSEIKDQQAYLINSLNRDIIVVPDRDNAGSKLVEQAIDYEWSVSMPDWHEDINDIGDAVARYGRIYTLYSIVTSAESSPLKIRLRKKQWFG